MSKSIEITEIKIKVGDKELSLTPEEARELGVVLDELLGKNKYVFLQSAPIHIEKQFSPQYPLITWNTQYTDDGIFCMETTK
jgi:two-component sensor histidine kinase